MISPVADLLAIVRNCSWNITLWRPHKLGSSTMTTHLQEFLEKARVKLLKHPAYNSDLAPCHFSLFPYVKLRMKDRRFSPDEELVTAVSKQCDFIPKQTLEKSFDEWFLRMKKCINCEGKYFGKFCKISMCDKLLDSPCIDFLGSRASSRENRKLDGARTMRKLASGSSKRDQEERR